MGTVTGYGLDSLGSFSDMNRDFPLRNHVHTSYLRH